MRTNERLSSGNLWQIGAIFVASLLAGCAAGPGGGYYAYPDYTPYYAYYGYDGSPFFGYPGYFDTDIIIGGRHYWPGYGYHHFVHDFHGMRAAPHAGAPAAHAPPPPPPAGGRH
jgi:hypothetical protein